MFSASGIKKLNEVKNAIELKWSDQLLQQGEEKIINQNLSHESIKIIKMVKELLIKLISNNKEEIQKSLIRTRTQLFMKNEYNEFYSLVFDQSTSELVNLLMEALQKINISLGFSSDLSLYAQAIAAAVDLETFIAIIQSFFKYQCQLHDLLVKNVEHTYQSAELSTRIYDRFNQLAIRAINDPSSHSLIIDDYQTMCADFINHFAKLPYFCIRNGNNFIGHPYVLTHFQLRSNRRKLILDLLNAEVLFKQKTKLVMTTVYDHYHSICSIPTNCQHFKASFIASCQTIISELTHYNKQRTTHVEKQHCANQLIKKLHGVIQALVDNDITEDECVKVYKALLFAQSQNQYICYHFSISLGTLSQKLNSYAEIFYQILFNEFSEKNDMILRSSIKIYDPFKVLASDGIITRMKDLNSNIANITCSRDEDKSFYSQQMALSLHKIINTLLVNDGLLINENLNNPQDSILNDIKILDNHSSTFVPVVFNHHSYKIAKYFLNTLKSINISKDLTEAAHIFLSGMKVDSYFFMLKMKTHLKYNLAIYEHIIKNQDNLLRISALKNEITEKMQALRMQFKGKPQEIENIQNTYKKEVATLIQRIAELPSYRIINGNELVNSKKPFKLDNLKITENYNDLILLLVAAEKAFNAETQLTMTLVRDQYSKYDDSSNIEAFNPGLFKSLCAKFIEDLKSIRKTSGMAVVTTLFNEKSHIFTQCIDRLLATLTTALACDQSLNHLCLPILETILAVQLETECIATNDALSQKMRNLLNQAVENFSKLTYFVMIQHKNDACFTSTKHFTLGGQV